MVSNLSSDTLRNPPLHLGSSLGFVLEIFTHYLAKTCNDNLQIDIWIQPSNEIKYLKLSTPEVP